VKDFKALVHYAEAYAQQLSRRDYNREGIEMFLALENLCNSTLNSLADTRGHDLAEAAEAVARSILMTRQGDPVRALRLATEVLAAYDLNPTKLAPISPEAAPDPAATGQGRMPLRLSVGAEEGAAQLVAALRQGQFLRAVNFHNTSQNDIKRLRRQLRSLSKRYQSVSEEELIRLAAGGTWSGQRPPLLLTFYEGLRNGYDVAAPLLDEVGLRGWFCLIPGFLDAPPEDQQDFALAHSIGLVEGEYEDPRLAMNWSEVRDLSRRGHEVICHTMTHSEPSSEMDDVALRRESLNAVERMETELDQKVETFVWRRGIAWGEDHKADALLQQAGVSLLLSNFKLQHLPTQPKRQLY
jgi:peptidoglycan/xylan/chitin deacetylase (PgdA/CDA1 family)